MSHIRWMVLGSLVFSLLKALPISAEPSLRQTGYFPAIDNREAWEKLPRAEKGEGEPLPTWARTMVRALPATTAAMLELDYLHRVENPLDARVRAKMRWTAAHANRCPYSEACALDDLKRAGLDEQALKSFQSGKDQPTDKERKALVFARQMMTEAYRITDDEVTDLIKLYGEKHVVAMVLMLAHASFQDRIILALGLGDDRDSPLAPVAVKFLRTEEARSHIKVPPRKPPESPPAVEKWQADRDWLALDRADLQKCMINQKERKSRIRIPSADELSKLPGADPTRFGKVIWNSVTSGYQPVLASGWSQITSSFRTEAKQDGVFSNSVFWVVTRSLQCFY